MAIIARTPATTSSDESITTKTTPDVISISMVLKDLGYGLGKAAICKKYNVKKWELDEIFKHPSLKNKKPTYIRTLSFKFIDDTGEEDVEYTPIQLSNMEDTVTEEKVMETLDEKIEEADFDKSQITIEDVIDAETTSTVDDESVEETLEETTEEVMEDETEEVLEEVVAEDEDEEFGSFNL